MRLVLRDLLPQGEIVWDCVMELVFFQHIQL
jgi:hypothetical protein